MMASVSAPPRTPAPRRANPPARASGRALRRPPREPRGLLWKAILASVLVHIVALLVLRFHTPAPGGVAPPMADRFDAVMRAVNILPVEGDVATVVEATPEPEPVTPQPARFPDAVITPPPAGPPAAEPDAPPTTRLPSVADRLTGRIEDPRLYAPPRELPPDLDAEVRGRVAGRIQAWNDSMAAAGAAAAAARDWTYKDSDGNRWGISPGAIHLGKLTIPLTSDPSRDVFQPPPDRRDQVNARIREWNEIQEQARRAETRAIFDERIKAIRARKEAERARADTTGGK